MVLGHRGVPRGLWCSLCVTQPGFCPFLCAAARKMRAPGSQLAAQTVWMASLPNPKSGACKFTPVSGAGGDGWLCWQGAFFGLSRGPNTSRARCLPWAAAAEQGCSVLGDLSFPVQTQTLLPFGGCHTLRVLTAGHAEGRLGSSCFLGKLSSPTPLICSLCSFGLWYQGSSNDPPAPSCSGAWEVIESPETQPEAVGEDGRAGSPHSASPPL